MATSSDLIEPDWDVLVVGRSYAGLSAALNLGRARRSVLVAGSGPPRNGTVHHVHGLITQDGASPGEVITAAEKDLARYPSVQLVDGRVSDLVRVDGGFRASVGGRPTSASLVVLATGANDNPPAIPGLDEHWGRGLFTCPYCDGFEHADLHLAVIGSPANVPHIARLLTVWSDRVTAFSADIDPAAKADLEAHGVTVDDRPITRVQGDGRSISGLSLADGSDVPVGALFVALMPTPNTALAVDLGCAVDDNGSIVVDGTKRTTVQGVWAVGDVTTMRANMSASITDGVLAATDCNMALLDRAWPHPS